LHAHDATVNEDPNHTVVEPETADDVPEDEPDEDVSPDEDDEDDEDPDEALDPREAARDRRRDREAAAERRALMRPGMGKVFKQITDAWGEKAAPDQNRARKRTSRSHDRPQ